MSRLARPLLRPPRRSVVSASLAAIALLAAVPLRASDGDWKELVPITGRPYNEVILDSPRDRLIVVGGMIGASTGTMDVWSVNLTGSPVWTKLVADGAGPARRYHHSVVLDPVGDRILVFGGTSSPSGAKLNDVWSLNLAGTPSWTELAPAGTPPAVRTAASATYDPVRQRMIVFGGSSASDLGDVWALSLSGAPAWTQLSPGGTAPSARWGHSAIYDPAADRLVVFGGFSGSTRKNDTWELSLAGPLEWTQLAPSGALPTARFGHSAIFDGASGRMIVFAGYGFATSLNDMWQLTLGGSPAWTQLAESGTVPGTREGHGAVWDTARARMLVFGGRNNAFPEEFFGNVAAFDLTSQVWTSVWPQAVQQGRYEYSGVYDPVRRRIVTFGGQNINLQATNEVWAYGLDAGGVWAKLLPTGASPSVRLDHSAIYDPVRDRMLVFGGSDLGLKNDFWSLSLGGTPAWSSVQPAGTPPDARAGHTAIYDPVRDRMLVFGGTGTSSYLNDVWSLLLSGTPTWAPVATAGAPPAARWEHTAIYDPVGDRMIVFGGSDGGGRMNDTWALSLSGTPTWSEITAGSPPSQRSYHTAVYDAARTRMVVFGGWNGGTTERSDTWALNLNATPVWDQLGPDGFPPNGRRGHIAIADPIEDRMIVSGGSANYFADTWELRWPQATGAPPPVVPIALQLGVSVPNPAAGRLTIPFGLPAAAHARLTVHDLQGRLIRTLVNQTLPAGTHRAEWDRTLANGSRAPSGVYLYRLDALGDHRSGRLVITD